MAGHDILFYFPQLAILFLFLIPLLLGQRFLWNHRQRQIRHYTDSSLLPQLLFARSNQFYLAKTIGWSLIWLFGCLALMGPFGNTRYPFASQQPIPTSSALKYRPHEVLFLVDTSASMGVLDGEGGQSRLDEAKEIIEDIIQQLKGQTVSLYAFTSELDPLVPATSDYLFTRLITRSLQINGNGVAGTNFVSVLKSLQERVFNVSSSKMYTLVLFSDGGDNAWEAATEQAKQTIKQEILDALPNPQQFFIQFFAVGMGDLNPQVIPRVSLNGQPVKSALNSVLLKAMAQQLNGTYDQASQWTAWNLSNEIVERMGQDPLMTEEEIKSKERQFSTVQQNEMLSDLYFQIPLGIAILFYLLNLLLPDVERHA
jgi:Ca-activated chloride channel homolog